MNPSKLPLLALILFASAAAAQTVPAGREIDRQYYWDENVVHPYTRYIQELIGTGNITTRLNRSTSENQDPHLVCAIAPAADWALNRNASRQEDVLEYLRVAEVAAYSLKPAAGLEVRDVCGVNNYRRTSAQFADEKFKALCARKPVGSKEIEAAQTGGVTWQYVSRNGRDYLPGKVLEDSLLKILKNDDKEVSLAALKLLRLYQFEGPAHDEFTKAIVEILDRTKDQAVKAAAITTLAIHSPTWGSLKKSLVVMNDLDADGKARGEAMAAFTYALIQGRKQWQSSRSQLVEIEVEPRPKTEPGVFKTYSPLCVIRGKALDSASTMKDAAECAYAEKTVKLLIPASYLSVPGATLATAEKAYCEELARKEEEAKLKK